MEEKSIQYYMANAKEIKKIVFAKLTIRTKKYVVKHIKKIAYIKKKQYLCGVKLREIINIVLLVVVIIMAKLVIIRALMRIIGLD